MPSTPTFAIPYPCSGDTIDPAVIGDWADGIDAALATVSEEADLALNRPSLHAHLTSPGQSYATGAAANFTFTEVDFSHEIGFVLPTTTFTLTRAGVYAITAQASHGSTLATTITRWQIILNVGASRSSRNLQFGPTASSQTPLETEGLFLCPAGTAVTVNFLWIGTGGPINVYGSLWANLISEL